jgi:hypothetical protein
MGLNEAPTNVYNILNSAAVLPCMGH